MSKKARIKKIVSFFLLLVLTTSCNPFDQEVSKITSSDLYRGTRGITMEFVKNAPAEEIYEDSDFSAVIDIRNRGAYSVGYENFAYVGGTEAENNEGIIVITPETGYVSFENFEDHSDNLRIDDVEKKALFKLRGRSLYDNAGEEEYIYLNLKTQKIGSLSQIHPSVIFATACYPYKTRLSTTICIDTDIYNLNSNKKACKVKDLSFSSGQGAPVTINKIEVDMFPAEEGKYKPQLILYIENKGSGEVVADYIRACGKTNKDEKRDDIARYFNIYHIRAYISTGENMIEMDCTNDYLYSEREEKGPRISKLGGKKGTIRCIAAEGSKLIDENINAYTAPLTIELDYGYMDTIAKNFKIKKP